MQKATSLTISQKGQFKGVVKNGLDSGTLIDLIVRFNSTPDFFAKRGFAFPNMFYYHRISRREVVGVLMNKYGYKTKKDAINALDGLVEKFGLIVINRKETDTNFENAVKDANNRVRRKNKKVKEIGLNDIIIIGGFLRENVNFVNSTDYAFLKTCKELGIETINITRA